jgi:hypothetical protein
VAAEIELDLAEDSLVHVYFRTEYRHNGNGMKLTVGVDDAELRAGGAFNNQPLSDTTHAGSGGTWYLGILGRDNFVNTVTPTAAKLRELMEGRAVILPAGAHTISARTGGNSTAEPEVRNSLLVARVEAVVAAA